MAIMETGLRHGRGAAKARRLAARRLRCYPASPMDALPATEITALLGRGTRFEGKLYFEGRVRVDGIFKGEIKSDDTLIIGDGAEVHAEIDVATVIIRGGVVHGNVRASQSIEIHAPGKLVGNIHSPSLYIERGVEFQGSCRMDAVDQADAQAARGTHDVREDNRSSRDMAAQPRA
jgi:cytoskeletal protein CcmA (bactofilin family)